MLLPVAARLHAQETASELFGLNGSPRQGSALLGNAPDGTMVLRLDDMRVNVDVDGRFIVAFDRDAPPQAVLRAEMYDDRVLTETLAVAPGNWRIEQVDAPLLGNAQTDEEFRQRRALELEQIAAARAVHSRSDGWRQKFILPVKARVSGVFGSQRIYQGTPASYHSGLDLAGGAGTIYVAPADGVVVLAASAPFTLEGNLLMVDHGMGLNSAFLHSQSLLVKQGDIVKQGQPLGHIGATGRVSGPHLHWSMKWLEARIDPATFVDVNVKL
ncbi:MAG: M23 family metallopeptidase [Sphingobium sp.]|nr:M23 family metallopeptidase [Sphingobium sp.]